MRHARKVIMQNSQKYVGRIVHLQATFFKALLQQANRQGRPLENLFIVSAVSRKKLICYGAHLRLVISPSDVVLA